MSFLLFAPDEVRRMRGEGRLNVVPDEQDALFTYATRSMMLSAIDRLSRDAYNVTYEACGDGPVSPVHFWTPLDRTEV